MKYTLRPTAISSSWRGRCIYIAIGFASGLAVMHLWQIVKPLQSNTLCTRLIDSFEIDDRRRGTLLLLGNSPPRYIATQTREPGILYQIFVFDDGMRELWVYTADLRVHSACILSRRPGTDPQIKWSFYDGNLLLSHLRAMEQEN